MQCQPERRNVTSNSQVRSSSGSSNDTHSWASAGAPRARVDAADRRVLLALAMKVPELGQELARREEALPELAHQHALIGRVVAVVRQRDAEKENRSAEDPAESFFWPAAPLSGEERGGTPDPLNGPGQGGDG